MDTTMWDAIIVGGGAAGLSAGVVLARARFATLVVDGGAPRNDPAAHMHGYLTRDGMAPSAFIATGRDEFTAYGGTLVSGTVTAARHDGGGFELRLDDGRALRSRSVLVATGLTDELPGIPGLRERWASRVHHCPHCHGHEVRGRAIAVIGGALAAASAHQAALLRRHSDSVTFCVNGAEAGEDRLRRLAAYGVRVIDERVTAVTEGTGSPVAVVLGNGETIPCDAVFVAPRPKPHDAVPAMLGAARDPATGLIAVDARGATSVPGLWAAGNVVDPRAQVVAAAGAGCTAAIAVSAWLLDRELTAAVEGALR